MGFIPQVSTKTLYAYLTPLGRQFILDGDKEDFQVAFFSLHDDDVDYKVTTNSDGTVNQPLTSGFIPILQVIMIYVLKVIKIQLFLAKTH
jgi:hypothetical protein